MSAGIPNASSSIATPSTRAKQIDGLAALVDTELGRDPADRSMYLFLNRRRDKAKLLIWHLNGYWLLHKRLERQRFRLPDWFEDDALELTIEQMEYLIDGYDLNGTRPHRTLTYERHL